jgi:DNA-binding MarR family transcriptional regulator
MHRAIWAVKRAHWKTWAWTRRVLRKLDVTPARFDALYAIHEHGVIMQSKLQRLLGVVRSTISELLRDLERLGLVVRGARCRSGRDVRLTEAGHDVIASAWLAQSDVDDEIFDVFGGPESSRSYVRLLLLERFCRHLRRAAGDMGRARVYAWLPYED